MTSNPLTFLFTDLENSTPLWEKYPDDMQQASARHDVLMRGAIEQYRGRVVKTTGDGFHAVFEVAFLWSLLIPQHIRKLTIKTNILQKLQMQRKFTNFIKLMRIAAKRDFYALFET